MKEKNGTKVHFLVVSLKMRIEFYTIQILYEKKENLFKIIFTKD